MNQRSMSLALLAGVLAAAPVAHAAHPAKPAAAAIPAAYAANAALLDDLSERTFRYFWDSANPANGLVPDRYPTPSFSSIAAVGFGLTAYTIGVDRGYVSRDEARERVLKTLRFFHDAPQGPQEKGMAGYKGFFYHFLDMKTGARYGHCELSTIDTALLLGGVLHVQSYFKRDDAKDAEIRRLADDIYRRVDWKWAAQARPPAVAMGWHPEKGMLPVDWNGYNEAMILYVLALGSPTHPLPAEAWKNWTSTYDKSWGKQWGQEYLAFAPHFGHQYSEVWIDFRGIRDEYMRGKGIDYFENSRRASYAQRAYATANPLACKGYGPDMWGVTASDGPADVELDDGGMKRRFHSYAGRGMGADHFDDCTMAPTGAAASIAFAPEIAIPAIAHMKTAYRKYIYGKYGFVDAFNLNFRYDMKVQNGRVIPGFGWADTDYLGIDQGPIVAMIANYRNESVWRATRTNPYIVAGLKKAGFTGGWLDKAASK